MNEMSKMIKSILLPAIAIQFLLAATSLGLTNFQALAQSTSSTANQTADLEPLKNSINETLQALQTNDTAAALQSLNKADTQLFEITRNLPSNADIEQEGEEEGG
jgi:Skp family chaperone for outer membrane proteins